MSRRITRSFSTTKATLHAILADPTTSERMKLKALSGLTALETAAIKLRIIRERETAREERLAAKKAAEERDNL